MAKKGAKGKGTKVLQPVVALYGLDPGTARGDAVRGVLAEAGVRVKTIRSEQLGDPVGSLAGLTGFHPARTAYDGEAPEGEFMLLCNFSARQTDTLLAVMRAANASVGCKAQVTQYNRLWPVANLIQQVAKEHAVMTGTGSQ